LNEVMRGGKVRKHWIPLMPRTGALKVVDDEVCFSVFAGGKKEEENGLARNPPTSFRVKKEKGGISILRPAGNHFLFFCSVKRGYVAGGGGKEREDTS